MKENHYNTLGKKYEQLAASWDKEMSSWWIQNIKNFLDLKASDLFCDIGGGSGNTAATLARVLHSNKEWLCVDPSNVANEASKRYG